MIAKYNHPNSSSTFVRVDMPRLPMPTGRWCVDVWLLDASKRGVSMQPQLNVYSPCLPDVGVLVFGCWMLVSVRCPRSLS